MEEYFGESFQAGVSTLTQIIQEVAYVIAGGVALIYYVQKINEIRQKGSYNMLSVLPVLLKPTVIFFLIITFTAWTDILGKCIFYIPEYIKGRYAEISEDQRREFMDAEGNVVDPWLHYQELAAKIRNQKSNQMTDLAMSANDQLTRLREQQEKAREDGDQEAAEAYGQQYDQLNNSTMDQLRELDDQTPSLIGEAIRNSVMWLFNWCVDGSYFLIVLVLEKIQEALLAFCLATGVIALLFSLIPGREGSFDTWLTYFIAIQFWTVVLTIVHVFYNASIIGHIKEMEGLLTNMSAGKPMNTDFFSMTIEYVANCISYIIIFISVPGLIQIFISKSGGSEMFSRFISQTTAGAGMVKAAGATATGYLTKAGGAAGRAGGSLLKK